MDARKFGKHSESAMKILFTISYYAPYVSGLTICCKRIAEQLAKRGHTVSVLTSQHDRKLPVHDVKENVFVTRVPYLFRISKGFFMPSYIFEAFLKIKKSDIVVLNLPQFEGIIDAIISKLLKKKLYCIYHCEVYLPSSVLNTFTEAVLHISHFVSLLCADKILTYTQDFANHSKVISHFSQKLVTIYPPVPIPLVDKKIQANLRAKVPSNKKYHIGLAVRIASEKGIEYLLQAIPILQKTLGEDFVILIAGPKHPVGEETYWEKIDPLVVQYKKHICFLGTLSSSEMGSFYSLLDVLVLPSVNSTEAFGMVQVEAMLCGVAVVATNLPGVRVPIQQTGMGELARIRDSKDLAEKITQVIKYKKNYIKKRSSIEKIFSFDDSINQYEKLFTSIS